MRVWVGALARTYVGAGMRQRDSERRVRQTDDESVRHNVVCHFFIPKKIAIDGENMAPAGKKKKKENSHTNLSSCDCECMSGCNTFSVDTACEVYEHGCKFKIMTVFVSFYQCNSDRWPVHLILMLADAAGQNPDVTLVLAAEGPCGLVTRQLLPVVRHMLSAEGSQNS